MSERKERKGTDTIPKYTWSRESSGPGARDQPPRRPGRNYITWSVHQENLQSDFARLCAAYVLRWNDSPLQAIPGDSTKCPVHGIAPMHSPQAPLKLCVVHVQLIRILSMSGTHSVQIRCPPGFCTSCLLDRNNSVFSFVKLKFKPAHPNNTRARRGYLPHHHLRLLNTREAHDGLPTEAGSEIRR